MMRSSSSVATKVGVLALQGDVREHITAFRRALAESGLEGEVFPLRSADEIASCDAIAIPGGESTTIGRLIDQNNMREPLISFRGGIFATCAGMVLVSEEVDDPRITPLGIVDIKVSRNAFGRQKESFEALLPVKGLETPFPAVFIRAPLTVSAGPGVEVLAETEQGIVAIREGRHMVLAFHPELCSDIRLHALFLDGLRGNQEGF